MKNKTQILIIHGGTPFDTYEEYLYFLKSKELTLERINQIGWKDKLSENLPHFEVIYPKMPNSMNAKYEEWKIWLEKMINFIHDDVILIGHSLGGIFLAKYLSENGFTKKIKSLHLIAAPYDAEYNKQSLSDFALKGPVSNIENIVKNIFIYQSKDDTEVSFHDAEKYKIDLQHATVLMFEDRGHFIQEQFPELIENISN